MINYYRDMWVRNSSLIAPLTSVTSKNVKFVWTDEHQKPFEDIKKVNCREMMLTFPYLSKSFHIYTDASYTQLDAVIAHDDKCIAFYSRKLNSAPEIYTTGKQELLSIIETLRELRNIILGYKIIVYTDKLLPLPQPPVCASTDAQTNTSAQRATQLRIVLARVYAVSIQNKITTTVP
jgi:hypothetical protein